MENSRVDAEFVLAHQGYVRGLARSLVFDETLADDLAQQVWLAALEHPPAHGHALRGWLATIARNLAALSRRALARRGERERAAARGETVAAADELVMRENLRASLVGAVLALDEPFRETIILRYFDGLSPRSIAAKQAVPVDTVKSRLKRGLNSLRDRLDRERGGRAAWCLAFVQKLQVEPGATGIAAFSAKSLVTGVALLTATKKFVVAAALLVACLAIWRVAAMEPSSEDAAGSDAAGEVAIELADPQSAPTLEPAASQDARRATPAPFWLRKEPPQPKTGPGDLDVSVMTMPGRVPLAGVAVIVRPATDPEARMRTATALTDANGVAHFEKLAPGDVKLDCDRGSGGGDLGGAYGFVSPGERRTAEIRIENPCTIAGRVVDVTGQAVEAAEIWLTQQSDPVESFRVGTSGSDGRFEIRGVKAKSVHVSARKSGHAPSARHFNFTHEGAAFEVELVLRGPAGSLEGLVCDELARPVANALVFAGPRGAASWLNPRGEVQTTPDSLVLRTDERGRFEFDGIQAGPCDVHVRALGFLDAHETLEIASGMRATRDLRLVRGATLAGFVKLSDGKPASRARIEVRASSSGLSRSTRADESGAYRLGGLEPGGVRLFAEDGSRTQSLDAELTLSAIAENTWSPTLPAGLELVGRVLDESGAPARKLTVHARREVPGEEPSVHAGITDRDGRFRVKGCRDVEYVVSVYPRDSILFAIAEVRGVRPGGEELVVQLVADRRPSAFITGRVVDPDGEALGGIQVTPSSRELDYNATQLTAADGSFRAGPFPVGRWRVDIGANGFAPHVVAEQPLGSDQTLALGTIQLARGDVIDVHLVYPDEAPAAKLYVEVHGLDNPIGEWCTVEGDHARTPPLPPGRYRLLFEGAYAACTLDAEVVAGRATKLELALKAGVALEIRFDDRRSGPPTVATLRVRDEAGAVLLERSPRLERSGPFQFQACLAPGRYRIEAGDATGRASSRELDVDASLAAQVVAIELR